MFRSRVLFFLLPFLLLLSPFRCAQAATCAPGEAIADGGFEDGTAPSGPTGSSGTSGPWSWTSQGGFNPISQPTILPPRTGSWVAYLGGYGQTNVDTVAQDVVLGEGTATLSFYLSVSTGENGGAAVDTLKVNVRTTSGTLLATLATLSNLDESVAYVQKTFDLTPYAGQTVRISFEATEDDTAATSFLVDDVSVQAQVCTGGESFSATKLVPIVLDVAGLGGSRFSTELTLANRGTTPASLSLTYTASTLLSGAGSGTVSESLDAGRQLVVTDTIAYLRSKGLAITAAGNQGGTLRIAFSGLSSAGVAYAGARTTTPSGSGRAGLSYPGPDLTEGFTGPSYVVGLRQNTDDRSNLALVNGSDSLPITLRVTLIQGDGAGAFSSHALPDVVLGPGQWTQISGVLAQAGFTNGFATIQLVAGPGPYFAYGVFNDNRTNDGSFVPAAAAGAAASAQLLPVLVETATFQSELILTNPGGEALTVTLQYVESLSPAGGAGGTVVESLAANAQTIIPDAIDHLRQKGIAIGARGAASYAGALRVVFAVNGTTKDGFVGARTAAPAPGGGRYGLFYPGVRTGESAGAEAFVFGLRQDAAVRSNLAVANVGDVLDTIRFRVEITNGDTGLLAGQTQEMTLAPGHWVQISGILSGFGVKNGYARVVRTSGNSRITVYGVVNDGASPTSGATNDGSYIFFSK